MESNHITQRTVADLFQHQECVSVTFRDNHCMSDFTCLLQGSHVPMVASHLFPNGKAVPLPMSVTSLGSVSVCRVGVAGPGPNCFFLIRFGDR